jgi:hypothetical protein
LKDQSKISRIPSKKKTKEVNFKNREEDISKWFSEEEQKILSNPKFDQGYAIEKSYSRSLSIAPNLSLIELQEMIYQYINHGESKKWRELYEKGKISQEEEKKLRELIEEKEDEEIFGDTLIRLYEKRLENYLNEKIKDRPLAIENGEIMGRTMTENELKVLNELFQEANYQLIPELTEFLKEKRDGFKNYLESLN